MTEISHQDLTHLFRVKDGLQRRMRLASRRLKLPGEPGSPEDLAQRLEAIEARAQAIESKQADLETRLVALEAAAAVAEPG